MAGWPLLADFHAQYFRFIEQTGGQSHLTFRTAAAKPKQAALQYILEEAEAGDSSEGESARRKADVDRLFRVVEPLADPLSGDARPHIHVPEPEEIDASDDYRRALAEGRVWFVEFCNSEAQRQVESQLAGRAVTRRPFPDYGGRPLLVFHAARR